MRLVERSPRPNTSAYLGGLSITSTGLKYRNVNRIAACRPILTVFREWRNNTDNKMPDTRLRMRTN